MTDIQTLMRSANPIEDARTEFGQEDLDALLLLTQRRSGDMDVKQAREVATPVTPEKRSRRGWLVAAVAFAGVIAVVAAAALLTQSTEEAPPATSPTTTLDASPPTTAAATTTVAAESTISAEDQAVLDAFVAAFNAGDEIAYEGLFAATARHNQEQYDQLGLDRIVDDMRWLALRGTTVSMDGCRVSGDRIFCELTFDGPVERAVLQVPELIRYYFTIVDGQIFAMESRWVTQGGVDFDPEWSEVIEWVDQIDPAAASAFGGLYPYLGSDEAALAWAEWAPLWRQAKRAGMVDETAAAMAAITTYQRAFNAGDPLELAEVLDEGVERTELLEPGLTLDATGLVAEAVELHAQGTTLNISECALEVESMRCTFTYSGPVPEALFRGPAVYTERVEVSEGTITAWETRCATCPGIEMYDAVVAWVAAQDPEAAARMGSQWYPKMTDGDPLLWLEWAPKWAEAGRP